MTDDLAALERAVHENPDDERACSWLARALARSGQGGQTWPPVEALRRHAQLAIDNVTHFCALCGLFCATHRYSARLDIWTHWCGRSWCSAAKPPADPAPTVSGGMSLGPKRHAS